MVIEGRPYPAREVIEALAQSGYAELRAVGDSLVLGTRRITPIFKSRQDRAMASLCHGSLAFCCPLSKRCAERDRALEMLGLNPDDYDNLKTDSHNRFIDCAKGVLDRNDQRYRDTSGGRQANRPAIDLGYGSDDYRRDFETLDHALHSSSRAWSDNPDTRRRSEYQPLASSRYRDRTLDDSNAVDTHATNRSQSRGSTCGACSEESVEGLGALFSQGELSPFLDNEKDDGTGRSFCFSCGRTFSAGTRVCPYCGARQ